LLLGAVAMWLWRRDVAKAESGEAELSDPVPDALN